MSYKMKGKEGMTTVELLAGLMIALILLGAGSAVFFAASGSFTKYAERSENQMITDSVCRLISDKIAFARYVSVGVEPEEDCHVFQFLENGHVLLDGEELYNDSFYHDKKLVCSIPENENDTPVDVFRVTIKMEDGKGKSLYSSDIVVKLVNVGISGGKIRYIMNGDMKKYVDSSDQAVYISYREE